MWYEDLTECGYFGEEEAKFLTAVGWLKNGKPFTKGESPKHILEKLYGFSQNSEMCVIFRGYHECDFCDFVNGDLGSTTIEIAYKDKVYVCPALIIHYIENHQYLPPTEFIEAVSNYDHQYAMDYFTKIGIFHRLNL